MKTIIKTTLVFAAGLALVTLLHLALTATAAEAPVPSRTAALAPQRASGNYGGDFRFPVVEPNNLDPSDVDSEGAIIGQVFEGLTRWDDDLEPLPAIAQSWESSDAMTWTFHIRHGARFHNGRQVTAQDVAYSWNRVATEGNWMYDYLVAPLINAATAVSSDTLQVTLNKPFAPFPSLLALPYMSIVPSETVSTIYTNPVGSGPFQFQSWTEGDSIVLTRYDGYYGGRPYLDRITYQFYTGEDAMYDDYLLGNLDLSPVPSDHISEVVGSPDAIFMNTLGLYYYGMKVDQAPFDDVRVRRALNYAVDRQDIVDDAASGYRTGHQVVAEGPVPPGMQGYDPPVPSYAYSPTLALELLAQAGWTDTNADGVLDDGAGTDLEIELMHNTSEGHAMIAQFIEQCFQDIGGTGVGATVVVSHTDSGTYYDNLDQYPFYRMGWIADYPDPLNFVAPFFRTGADQNHMNYSNPQVDAWLALGEGTLDNDKAFEYYEAVETQVQDDAPLINLFYYGAVYVQSEDVLGLAIPRRGLDAIQVEKVQLFLRDHDVEVASILYPKESVLAGEPIAIVVKVRNAGRHPIEFNVPVRCRILQDGIEVYSDTLTIVTLEQELLMDESFAREFAALPGDHTIECTTLLDGDEDPANDQETRDFTVTEDAFYDGYIRDNETDAGSICTTRWWGSPDIIVRHEDDNIRRHQDPILGQTNYVYVRVRNLGNATITDGYVNVYWHAPSAGIICGNWELVNPIPIEYEIGGWVFSSWTPHIEGHTCLFARFLSPDDPVSAECDVACDNNIAQRNVEVVDLEGENGASGMRSLAQTGQASVVFEVSNVYDLLASVDLIVERGTFPTTGTLTLEFSRDLFSRWQDAGGTVEGGTVIPGTTRISVTHPVSTTVAGLPMGVREMQQARMYLTGPPGAEFALHVTERIHGQIVGGMTYRTEIPWTIYLPVVLRDYSGGS